MDIFGLKYQEAHHIATSRERRAAEGAGVNWNAYQKHIFKYRKPLSHEDLTFTPKDLDLTPYKQEKDYNILYSKHRKRLE